MKLSLEMCLHEDRDVICRQKVILGAEGSLEIPEEFREQLKIKDELEMYITDFNELVASAPADRCVLCGVRNRRRTVYRQSDKYVCGSCLYSLWNYASRNSYSLNWSRRG